MDVFRGSSREVVIERNGRAGGCASSESLFPTYVLCLFCWSGRGGIRRQVPGTRHSGHMQAIVMVTMMGVGSGGSGAECVCVCVAS